MKYWEIIADNPIWIADAHRDDGKRFIVHADEKLSAFIELASGVNRDVLSRIHSSRFVTVTNDNHRNQTIPKRLAGV